jgi:hypothetical protein
MQGKKKPLILYHAGRTNPSIRIKPFLKCNSDFKICNVKAFRQFYAAIKRTPECQALKR